MQQIPQPLNPWLVSYIRQHKNTQTRHDIDKYLINAGYNPTEIEEVWQHLSKTPLKPVVEKKLNGWGLSGGILGWVVGFLIGFSRIDMVGTGLDNGYAEMLFNVGGITIALSIIEFAAATFVYRKSFLLSAIIQLITALAGFLIIIFIAHFIDLALVFGLFLIGGITTLQTKRIRRQNTK